MVFRDAPIGGSTVRGAMPASEAEPLPPVQERPVSLEDLGLKANAPDLGAAPPQPRATVAVPVDNIRLSQILDTDDDDEAQIAPRGVGPRLIIMHDYVMGHTRGKVVWASDLIVAGRPADATTGYVTTGADIFREGGSDDEKVARPAQALIRRQLKRLLDSKAVREANTTEAQYEFVKFVETQEEAENALVQAQGRNADLESEVAHLRALIARQQDNLQESGPFDNPGGGSSASSQTVQTPAPTVRPATPPPPPEGPPSL